MWCVEKRGGDGAKTVGWVFVWSTAFKDTTLWSTLMLSSTVKQSHLTRPRTLCVIDQLCDKRSLL